MKDSFLRKAIDADPDHGYELRRLLKFNRLRQLLFSHENDEERLNSLRKCAADSKELKLFCDGKKVRRKRPFKLRELDRDEVDTRMIYVEGFPPSFTHEQLARVFTRSGTVAHVSVPRHHESKRNKGFAFVEFETPEAAHTATKTFDGLVP